MAHEGNTHPTVPAARVPRWVAASQLCDRFVWSAFRAYEVTYEEILFAWLDPAQRHAVTQAVYERQRTYLPGGTVHERGLFPWEQAALADPRFPQNGRLLLGAAGGGRELRALLQRGYDVFAFEPTPFLFAGMERMAGEHPRATLRQASYDDLVQAVARGDGPLRSLPEHGSFDAVVLGWGSLTHVTCAEERRSLLRSLRQLAPGAPILASFFLRTEPPGPARSERWRRELQRVFRRGRTPSDVPRGLSFERHGGFAFSFTPAEITALAEASGYRIAFLHEEPFPHALFVPTLTGTRDSRVGRRHNESFVRQKGERGSGITLGIRFGNVKFLAKTRRERGGVERSFAEGFPNKDAGRVQGVIKFRIEMEQNTGAIVEFRQEAFGMRGNGQRRHGRVVPA